MKNHTLSKFIIGITFFLFVIYGCKETEQKQEVKREKTAFQTSSAWSPEIDIRADIAIIYGIVTQDHLKNGKETLSFNDRVKSWQEKGYTTHFMTGIAWGEYADYFNGEWDGKTHLDEGQKNMHGDTLWHHPGVPYIVPSKNFLAYMKEKHIKPVIDAGIDAIYLEEPEFWAFAGYSDAFKNEWKEFYGFDWRPQHESAENLYLSNKLKYHLYYRALEECFTYAKEYGKSKGMDVRCYVPTHSLINYSQWHIVSPEASLASMPCVDGYIAQVWTGTSRTPNYYNGIMKERVFETAFMEYGCMESMTAPTGRKVFFLTDPIEDRPRDWDDFRRNYEATFTAKLLYPDNNNYEVIPWPERIYNGLYNASESSNEKVKIPHSFSTQMQIMINSLNDMPLSENKVSGSDGISVLMANSLMFQRNDIPVDGYEDPQLSNFFGLVMPLLKQGAVVNPLHIENTGYENTWKDVKVLLMTYSNMKPLDKKAHANIAKWVKSGGLLLYAGRDNDPFNRVEEWWNTNDNNYKSPADHLFEQLAIGQNPKEGLYTYGKGKVLILRQDPKEFVMTTQGDQKFVNEVKSLYREATGTEFEHKNYFTLDRGNYKVISTMEESINNEPYTIKGLFIDLFDPALPILTEKIVPIGRQAFLYDIDKISNKAEPQILASASRAYDIKTTKKSFQFIAKSPSNTFNVSRILLPSKPKEIRIDKNVITDLDKNWDSKSSTYLLQFENSPSGVPVSINW